MYYPGWNAKKKGGTQPEAPKPSRRSSLPQKARPNNEAKGRPKMEKRTMVSLQGGEVRRKEVGSPAEEAVSPPPHERPTAVQKPRRSSAPPSAPPYVRLDVPPTTTTKPNVTM